MDFYEYDADIYADPGFPVYFSGSTLHREVDSGYRYLHWHEAVEILYCIEGEGVAVSDALSIPLAAGEIAVIGGNRLHTFYTEDVCRYAYLLVGSELSASRDLPGVRVQPFISDPEAERQLRGILRELREQAPFYRSEVCARLTRFFVYLCRNYPESESASEQSCAGKRLELSRLQPHQAAYLASVQCTGGLAGVLARFEHARVYWVPYELWAAQRGLCAAGEGIKGRKSIAEKDLGEELRVDGYDWMEVVQ